MRTRALLLALVAAVVVPALAGAAEEPPPNTTITSGPPNPSGSSSAGFIFTSDQVGSTFACALDQQSFKRCSSPQMYTNVPDGLHTFFVFAVNDKRKDPTPAAWTWTVDTTAPAPVKLERRSVSYRKLLLTWALSPGTDHVVVLRNTKAKHVASTEVYRGAGTRYVESKFVNAQYHAYRITSYDKAGNVSAAVDITIPASALLLAPADRAKIHRAPTFGWRAVKKASYYNVQLWRGGEKILSTWPKGTKLKLTRTWTYNRRRYKLKPGRYIWIVWPGFGAPSKGIYGQPLGQASFVAT
jgi:hypothetical protein